MLAVRQAPDALRISGGFRAHSRESTHDAEFAPRWTDRTVDLQAEAREQALLGLALDLGDDLDVALQRGAAQLRGEQVVDLEDAGGVVHLDLHLHRALVSGLDPHLVDRRRREGMDAVSATLHRDA